MDSSVRAADTFSNVAFWAAAAVIWLEFAERSYAEAMSVSLIFVGLWSAAFHATNADHARHLDEIGIYAVLSVLLVAAVAGWLGLGETPFIHIIMMAVWLTLTAFHQQIDSHVFVPAMMAVAFLLIFITGDTVLALFAATLAILAWFVNKHGGYGHAGWHVCVAVAAFLAFIAI